MRITYLCSVMSGVSAENPVSGALTSIGFFVPRVDAGLWLRLLTRHCMWSVYVARASITAWVVGLLTQQLGAVKASIPAQGRCCLKGQAVSCPLYSFG